MHSLIKIRNAEELVNISLPSLLPMPLLMIKKNTGANEVNTYISHIMRQASDSYGILYDRTNTFPGAHADSNYSFYNWWTNYEHNTSVHNFNIRNLHLLLELYDIYLVIQDSFIIGYVSTFTQEQPILISDSSDIGMTFSDEGHYTFFRRMNIEHLSISELIFGHRVGVLNFPTVRSINRTYIRHIGSLWWKINIIPANDSAQSIYNFLLELIPDMNNEDENSESDFSENDSQDNTNIHDTSFDLIDNMLGPSLADFIKSKTSKKEKTIYSEIYSNTGTITQTAINIINSHPNIDLYMDKSNKRFLYIDTKNKRNICICIDIAIRGYGFPGNKIHTIDNTRSLYAYNYIPRYIAKRDTDTFNLTEYIHTYNPKNKEGFEHEAKNVLTIFAIADLLMTYGSAAVCQILDGEYAQQPKS